MFSKREVTSSVLEACRTRTTTYSVNLQKNRAVMETVPLRHQNCKRKTKQRSFIYENSSSLPTLSFSGSCTCTTTAAHKDCKNTKGNTLHFIHRFTSNSDITEHRIRNLLVFQDSTSRNKPQVFIYMAANYSSTENMHWKDPVDLTLIPEQRIVCLSTECLPAPGPATCSGWFASGQVL